ncbi:MAG: site-specific integrase [Betaproteobacteria bacterium]|nr:site-specific integrase [Betaproteobacteria bacterium]
MSLYKRRGSPYWWVRFTYNGRRVQESAGTADRVRAEQFEARRKAALWEQDRLGARPERTWQEAVLRWLKEMNHKATHRQDIAYLRWFDKHLRGMPLHRISRDKLVEIADIKAVEASPATANHYMALIRALLRKACFEWEWLDRVPKVRMYKLKEGRVRWITREDFERLALELPPHLADMARFAVYTGLRRANVTGLEWEQVRIDEGVAWIHPDQAKARKAIAVPLNSEAMAVVRKQIGKHPRHVFTYLGKPVRWLAGSAWKRALRRAGIEDFRWHDLRHTWASWHVQAGTPQYELQQLGGWRTALMVQRYAHFGPQHLAVSAARIVAAGTKAVTAEQRKTA